MDDDEHAQEIDYTRHIETVRTAAFSDSVFAIAITLVALDLKPPELAPGESLNHALIAMWPRYVALVSSFAIIGLMWIHHHRVFRFLDHADHMLLKLNLLLMLGVSVVPFPTSLLAQHPDERISAVLYTSVVGLDAILFNLVWRHARRANLLRREINRVEIAGLDKQYLIGGAAFLLLIVVSLFSIRASIIGNIVLAIFFALPLHVIEKVTGQIPRRLSMRGAH